MTARLKALLDAVHELSPVEQLELIGTISQLLQQDYPQIPSNTDFWHSPSLEQIVQTQQSPSLDNIANWAVDFWPAEESIDEVIGYIYQQRQEDRMRI